MILTCLVLVSPLFGFYLQTLSAGAPLSSFDPLYVLYVLIIASLLLFYLSAST